MTRDNKTIYMTSAGVETLSLKIESLKSRINEIQEEKAIAYWGSGDGWHDNPGFNQLEQLEHRKISELVELRTRLSNSKVWDESLNDGKSVQIGSVVEYQQVNQDNASFNSIRVRIVGFLESNLTKMHIAYDSPIGEALLHRKVGDQFELIIPKGTFRITIKSIEK